MCCTISAILLGFNDPNLEVRNLPWIIVVFEIQDAGKKIPNWKSLNVQKMMLEMQRKAGALLVPLNRNQRDNKQDQKVPAE